MALFSLHGSSLKLAHQQLASQKCIPRKVASAPRSCVQDIGKVWWDAGGRLCRCQVSSLLTVLLPGQARQLVLALIWPHKLLCAFPSYCWFWPQCTEFSNQATILIGWQDFWFPVLLLQVVRALWWFPQQPDLLSQINREIWLTQPSYMSLYKNYNLSVQETLLNARVTSAQALYAFMWKHLIWCTAQSPKYFFKDYWRGASPNLP